MIYIENKKKKEKTLEKKYPNAKIVDVTSKSTTELIKLSPFYPHGDIPIPFSEPLTAKSVEGIWQALKVFDNFDIDVEMFHNSTMKNIKRTIKKYGKPIGHRKGIKGDELLNYIDARIKIYLPSYLWILENKVGDIIEKLRELSNNSDLVLLDYGSNCDLLNTKKPLSHAYLVKAYIEGNYPSSKDLYKELEQRELSLVEEKKMGKSVKVVSRKTKLNANDNQIKLF